MAREFYIIIFAFIPAILATVPHEAIDLVNKKLASDENYYNTCLNETGATDNDIFTLRDIMQERHKQSENQEKLRKNSCLFYCMIQKENMIEESEFNLETIHTKFTEKTNIQPGHILYKALDDCIEEVKDITDKYEKSFGLVTCYFKAKERFLSQREHREEIS
ncbi:pheromone-binding protein Gp-9-like [Camponotus floridanus]|uniref:pheromone-binding protein Gp-9-like n=1 Tax=Camponotus floridanus TaxID=104421 RepID=UPI000DC6AB3F|nr:pheromone-binding protein Gp-9-like [Camponotus floridanus]